MGIFDIFTGGKAPQVPVVNTAQLIQDQLKYARPNQYNSDGSSLTYGGDGSINVNEGAWGKQFREGQQGQADALANYLKGQFGSMPDVPTSVDWSKVDPIMGADGFSSDADKVTNATFERGMGLLRPEWDARDRASSESLVQSGNPAGNERFSIEKNRLGQQRMNAEAGVAQDAVLAGRAEQSRLMDLAAGTRAEQTQRQLTDTGLASAGRDTTMNAMGNYLSGSYTPKATTTNADFFAPGNIDVLGPAQMAQSALSTNAMLKAQQQQAGAAGAFSLGSSLIKASPFLFS